MRMFKLALAAATLAVGTPALADISVDARQANQMRQIDAGKRSGKLSRSERDILTAEQHRIAAVEARLKRNGGKLGTADDRRLRAMLDRAQHHIDRLKHNRVRGRNGIHI